MTSDLSGSQFGRQAAVRTAVFLVLMFGIPLVLYALDAAQGSEVALAIATQALGAEDAPSDLLLQLTINSYWVYALNPYVCALFAVLVAWCVVISRRSPDDLRVECGK